MTDYNMESGVLTSNLLPQSLRTYYESQLLNVLRADTIFSGFARRIVDFAARDTKTITFSRVFDLQPAFGELSEAVPFIEGAYLDSEQVSMTLSEHGNTIKTNQFHESIQFWNGGNFRAIVQEKLGRNLVESMEILARNEFLTTSYKHYPNSVTARADLSNTDVYLPDFADLSRTDLQSRNAMGLNGDSTPICIVHPRQGRDIRKSAGSDWKEAQLYAGAQALIRGEIGLFDGVRYVQNNFCRLPNAGATEVQSTLSDLTYKGQGGPNSGSQSPARLTYVPVTSTAGFTAGMEVTIHDSVLGAAVLETDTTAETRVIKTVESGKIYFTKPLLVAHASGANITEARDIYDAVMISGPGMVWGVAAQPQVIVPPQIDDFARISRISWYTICDFSLIDDTYVEVWETAASTSNYGNN